MKGETVLLQEVAAGDRKAFKTLFDQYYPTLHHYLLRITKSGEIAEELTIDIFLKLWIGRDLLLEVKNMDAFLHKVAYNKALDFFRAAARQRRLQKLVAREMEQAEGQEADRRLLDHEYDNLLEKAIDQLSPRRKLVFTLSRVEGLTHEEIARRLHLSRNTVKNTMAESLKSIRHFLQVHDVEGVVLLMLLLQS